METDDAIYRYLSGTEGGSHKDTPGRGTREEATEEEGLGAVAGQTDYGPEAVLPLVRHGFSFVNWFCVTDLPHSSCSCTPVKCAFPAFILGRFKRLSTHPVYREH